MLKVTRKGAKTFSQCFRRVSIVLVASHLSPSCSVMMVCFRQICGCAVFILLHNDVLENTVFFSVIWKFS